MIIMKLSKIILVFVVLLMTKISFAGCNVDLNIIPPESDGGSPLTYYRVEYRELYGNAWIMHGKVRAEKSSLWGNYVSVIYQVNDLKPKVQYLFRVIAENKFGQGAPGDAVITETLKEGTFGPIDVRCGENVPGKSGRAFDITDFLLENNTPNIQIPYRLKE